MTDLPSSTSELRNAVIRFDSALSALEARLKTAIDAISGVEISPNPPKSDDSNRDIEESTLILREELAYAKSREKELEAAISNAKEALNDAIDDIRQTIGSV